jgi:sporulation protein YlmC with PRC-barrel domain
MAGYGMLTDYVFDDRANDIRGASVYAINEQDKFGKIKDVVFDQNTGKIIYLIVDADHSKFLVPPSHIWEARQRQGEFVTDLSRTQIDNLPTLDLDRLKHDNQRWRDYESEYRSSWPEWQTTATGHGAPVGNRVNHFEDRIRADRERIPRPADTGMPPQVADTEQERKAG